MKATDLLTACIDVQAERGKEYQAPGQSERNFDHVAKAFNALADTDLSGSDVALILTLLKARRQLSNPGRLHADSLLDFVSYAALWGQELYAELEESKP